MNKKACLFVLTALMLLSGHLTSAKAAWEFWEPLTYFNPSTWQKADNYSNGSMFNCTWKAGNANFTSSGKLELKITSPSYNKFDCGEYRSTNN